MKTIDMSRWSEKDRQEWIAKNGAAAPVAAARKKGGVGRTFATIGLIVIGLGVVGHIFGGGNNSSATTTAASSGETYRLVFMGEDDTEETTFATGLSQRNCKAAKAATRANLPATSRALLDAGVGYFGCQPESSYHE